MKRIFKTLLSVEEAKGLLNKVCDPRPLGYEEVPLLNALGRVLAEDVASTVDVPSFDRALRDGYAVRYEDVALARDDSPIKLRVVGILEAGFKKVLSVGRGEAVKVATGAPVPVGANAIVPEEHTKYSDGYVYVYKAPSPHEWIQFTGADLISGEVVLHKGTLITPRELGILASIGLEKIKVYKRPKVGIISIGDELRRPGDPLDFGEIYDVNSYTIYGLLAENGAEPYQVKVARDDPEEIRSLILDAVGKYDVVITSGSTSVGAKDLLLDVLSELGNVIFYGIKATPGKPSAAAVVKGKLVIGLPGFPVSCLMIFDSVFVDVIRMLAGLPPKERYYVKARAGAVVRSKEGLRSYQPVLLKKVGDVVYFYPVHLTSGSINLLYRADGYVEVPENVSFVDYGEVYDVNLFSRNITLADLIVVTSHSLAFDRLLSRFKMHNPTYNIKLIYAGSMGALIALKEGYNDIGGLHLLDEETHEYNVPFLKRLRVRNVRLYRGFDREIGFVVKKGNPKGIRSFYDIVDKGVRFINRSHGSGIRTFIDVNLKAIAKEKGLDLKELASKIEGYTVEAKTHTSVVTNVERGRFDVGVVDKLSTIGRDVDFIPLTYEKFDFIVNLSTLVSNAALGKLVEYLGSNEAVDLLKELPGIEVGDDYMNVLYES